MTAAIILAGGLSERLSEIEMPKQYVEIAGTPIIIYCLRVFEHCTDIDGIVIVAHERWQKLITLWLNKYGIKKCRAFAYPGKTRQYSVYNGLLALQSCKPDLAVIHDAARPLVTGQDISKCINSSVGYDGATPAIPITETAYQSIGGNVITGLINRDELYIGQTPEVYNFSKYLDAYSILSDLEMESIKGSSELAFMAGMKIHLYRGDARNIKITTFADMEYFKYLVEVGKV